MQTVQMCVRMDIVDLKKYGAGVKDLLDVYIQQFRCVLEMTAPVWNTGITVSESKK